ncbi:MAG: hypothetical protein IJ480_11120, partial [Clostridia bacterium]|nr:hypothetical protein [Clostridia bacterium]
MNNGRHLCGVPFVVKGKAAEMRKKPTQKALTKCRRYDIIPELSGRAQGTGRFRKNFQKVLKNLLTNGDVCDILYRLSAGGRRKPKRFLKKLEKSSKNLLTNESGCDIIYRLPTRGNEEPTRFTKKLQ